MACFTVINKTALETDVSAQCDTFGVCLSVFVCFLNIITLKRFLIIYFNICSSLVRKTSALVFFIVLIITIFCVEFSIFLSAWCRKQKYKHNGRVYYWLCKPNTKSKIVESMKAWWTNHQGTQRSKKERETGNTEMTFLYFGCFDTVISQPLSKIKHISILTETINSWGNLHWVLSQK